MKIDQGIAGQSRKWHPQRGPQNHPDNLPSRKGKYRKPGDGCISQINDHLWESGYSSRVNGKRVTRNVYAHSGAECEERLAKMTAEMKAEITGRTGAVKR